VVERLCSFLREEGWESSVITTSLYCNDDGTELQCALRERIDATVLPIRGPRFFKRAECARHVIDKAVSRADVVHLHTIWHPLNTVSRKACQRHDRKYVLMPHGMLDAYSLAQKRWRKKLYLVAIERCNLQGASGLVFTATQEEDSARKILPWLTTSVVIPLAGDNPPQLSRRDARRVLAAQFPQIADRRCVLFLGRIDPKKGLERLITALPQVIKKHPSVLLTLAGDGEPSYLRKICNHIYATGLTSHVLLTGALAGKTKWAALGCAELFVLPSKQENFAIAVAEAMHMALPVVITNKVDSWPLVAKANAGVILDDATADSKLAEYLNLLLDAPDDAQYMGRRGQDFAKVHLTWQRVAHDIAALYRRILSE
jgi:glycosyltransferase involved in cell wall biosynthesis